MPPKTDTPWKALAEPFAPSVIKERPGRGGMTFSYVDARIVAQRLDDVLTPEGWDFEAQTVAGSEVVHGRLVIFGDKRPIIREDFGYPNGADDDEPIKSAASDALKRCAVQVGVGRHLYTDNKAQRRPQAVSGPTQRTNGAPRPSSAPTDGPTVKETLDEIAALGLTNKDAGDVAKKLFGNGFIKELDPGQRALLLEELATTSGVGLAPSPGPSAPARETSSPESGPPDPDPPFDELPWN